MSSGLAIVAVAVVVAMGFGLWRVASDGRFRGTHRVRGGEPAPESVDVESVLLGTAYADRLGERATLLQFSSAFCAPCRATRRVLEEVARIVPGVTHVDVDAESHLDLVRRLGVLRTPTTVLLDQAGRELTRAEGAPSRDQVLSALDAAGC